MFCAIFNFQTDPAYPGFCGTPYLDFGYGLPLPVQRVPCFLPVLGFLFQSVSSNTLLWIHAAACSNSPSDIRVSREYPGLHGTVARSSLHLVITPIISSLFLTDHAPSLSCKAHAPTG